MKKKLSTRIAAIEAILVLLTMTALITVAVVISTKSVSAGTNGTLSAVASQNAIKIQSMLNTAQDAADSLRSYIDWNYQETNSGTARNRMSTIYGTTISIPCKSIETMAIETGWRNVESSENLEGLGIFFEPYAFDDTIERFAVYIDKTMAVNKTVSAYTEDYTQEAYYKDAVEQNRVVITDPFMWGDIFMVSIAYPIEINDQVVGAVISDISMDGFSAIQAADADHPTMHAGIVSENGTVMFDSKNADAIGSSLETQLADSDMYAAIIEKFGEGISFQIETVSSEGKTEISFFEPIALSGETWWSQTVIDKSDFNSASVSLIIWLIAVALSAALLIIAMTSYFLRKELRPIQGLVNSARKIGNGDLEADIAVKSENEIGQLALSFGNMAEGLRLIINDISSLLTAMANNNFSVRSANGDRYVGEYGTIYKSMQHIKATLSGTLLEIRKASDQVSSASEQVSSGAQSLAEGATEQAASVEELSASISEISGQIDETAKNAGAAASITSQVSNVMSDSVSEMHQLMDAMSDISKTTENIRKVIKVMDDIAFQTDILALNAAVEAARVGSAGKGFAVVADEVKNLAHKSSESAKDTTALIESVVSAVGKGVTLTGNANRAFEEVNEKASSVKELVSDISSAAEAQSLSIRQVLAGIEQISGVVQMNSATAEESAAASEELSSQANMLRDLVTKFILDDQME
ncbi:MAG: methyl-accepting chemotaxis protein [Oscillospiraceae bacterium]